MKIHNQQTVEALKMQHQVLSEAIINQQYEDAPQLWSPYGDEGKAKSIRDAGYHLTYLIEALSMDDESLFLDYITWVRALFASIGLPKTALHNTLCYTRKALETHLSPEVQIPALSFINAAITHLETTSSIPITFLSAKVPLADLAKTYLDALLQADRRTATQLIMEAIEQGVSVKEIYLNVFQRTQQEIGRLWQLNKIDVAQEHYCTAATQAIMSQLYPYIFSTERIGRHLVATCVGGELHEIGIRMVADFFEMEGWDTYYLGANTPPGSLLKTIEERPIDILGISATMTFHVSAVAELITQVRQLDKDHTPKILVGGYPFNTSPTLYQKVGADGYAHHAQEAIVLATQLIQ